MTGSRLPSTRVTTRPPGGVPPFATFLTFMTVGWLVGTSLLDRHGRVPVLRISFGLAVVGTAGHLRRRCARLRRRRDLGSGSRAGLPCRHDARRPTILPAPPRGCPSSRPSGMPPFIAGPLLGFLGDHVGVLKSLLVVGVGAVLALLMVLSVREPEVAPAFDDPEPTSRRP